MKFDLIIAGVGGQGIIFTTNVIGRACIKEGKKILAAETHGMAQRGGSVETHIRIGTEFGPLIPKKKADALLGFEPIEALRYSHFLSRKGIAIINTEKIIPPSCVFPGKFTYPDVNYLMSKIKEVFGKVIILNALKLARESGSIMTVNMVMLGVLTNYLPLEKKMIIQAIKELVPEKLIEANLRAFEKGVNFYLTYKS